MQLSQNFIEDILKMDIDGRIDSVTAKSFEQQMLGIIDKGHHKIILNFSNLDFISSSGLRVLLLAAKKLKIMNGQLVLSDLNGDVREVFDVTGFSSIFYIYNNMDLALKHFSA